MKNAITSHRKKNLFRKLKVMRWGIQRILYYKQIEHP